VSSSSGVATSVSELCYFTSNSVICVRDQDTKKEKRKKDKERDPTVANWVFAETTHVAESK